MQPIATGTRFGPYEILSLLGAGGMGEVYRARDARLGRDVALKVLPAAYCEDRHRLRRFEHEAKAAGALNHPSVVSIHDVGLEHGQPFLVSELLEGETLRERLARGALPPVTAVEIAGQIAHGLAAAHAKGILHRDLKPENLFLTRDGRAKILDFGIAKLTQPEASQGPDAATATGVRETEAGAVVGTVGYMAPEQVLGRLVDQRSDLFAVGAVLYEMLAGARAFTSTSHIGTLNAIVEATPPELPETVPTAVRRIVQRRLQKDPDARFQSAADLAFALDGLTEPGRLPAQPPGLRQGYRLRRLAIGAAAGVVAVGLGYAGSWLVRPPAPGDAPAAVRRFVIQPPAGAQLALAHSFALSPDATRLVYSARVGAGTQAYIRRLDQLDVTPVPGAEGASSPFFSPDGQWIGFSAGGRLRKVPAAGGTPVALADGAGLGFHGGSWGPDGQILFSQIGTPVVRVSAEGGTPAPVLPLNGEDGEIDHHSASHLPGGGILYTSHAGPEVFRVVAKSLATGEQRTLVEDGFHARYVPTGHLVYARGETLFAAGFDPERLDLTGPEVAMVENLSTVPDSGRAAYAIAADGTLAYVPAPSLGGRTLVWLDRSGRVDPVAMPPRPYSYPSLSPDGRTLAVQVADGARLDVWTHRFADGAATRLAVEGVNSRPLWTPDGSHLTFSTRRGGERLLVRQATDGSASSQTLASSRRYDLWPGAWTPDGETLAFVESPPTDISDIKLLRQPQGAIEPLIASPATESGPVFSPDGRWIAYQSNESGRGEVYVRPFPGPGVPRQISTDGGSQPRWSRDGRDVFFLAARRMMAVPVETASVLDVGAPRVLFALPFPLTGGGLGPPPWDVTPDGQRFIFVKPSEEELAPLGFHIVENWTEELKRRVPAR